MLGDFITRGLILVLGYAYPAFECFKTLEFNGVEIEQLRFWCQYWIIVSLFTVMERIGDFFVAWLPLYGELKLALIVYLWYPKTKGSDYMYEKLRTYVSAHEAEIETTAEDLRRRVWDLAIYYWQNSTQLVQLAFIQIAQFLLSQSNISLANPITKVQKNPPDAPPMPKVASSRPSFKDWDRRRGKNQEHPGVAVNRAAVQPPQPSDVQVQGYRQDSLKEAREETTAEASTAIVKTPHIARMNFFWDSKLK